MALNVLNYVPGYEGGGVLYYDEILLGSDSDPDRTNNPDFMGCYIANNFQTESPVTGVDYIEGFTLWYPREWDVIVENGSVLPDGGLYGKRFVSSEGIPTIANPDNILGRIACAVRPYAACLSLFGFDGQLAYEGVEAANILAESNQISANSIYPGNSQVGWESYLTPSGSVSYRPVSYGGLAIDDTFLNTVYAGSSGITNRGLFELGYGITTDNIYKMWDTRYMPPAIASVIIDGESVTFDFSRSDTDPQLFPVSLSEYEQPFTTAVSASYSNPVSSPVLGFGYDPYYPYTSAKTYNGTNIFSNGFGTKENERVNGFRPQRPTLIGYAQDEIWHTAENKGITSYTTGVTIKNLAFQWEHDLFSKLDTYGSVKTGILWTQKQIRINRGSVAIGLQFVFGKEVK